MIFKQTMIGWSVALALLAVSGGAAASGFALIEQSGSGLGNAFAGGAASAEDASTVFFNPAGMSRLSDKQIVLAGHIITPSAKFSGTGASGTDMGGDAGGSSFVPNAYFTMEMTPDLKVGLGVNAPFGLQTEYDSAWVGRYHAIKSKIETVNINPSVSYRVNDALSIGAGVDYQEISGELSNFDDILGTTVVKGKDNAWGYNLGGLYNISSNARIGIAYRSAISYTLQGDVSSSLPYANTPVSLDLKVPDSLSMSVFSRYSDQWDFMADVSWTGWSSFKQIKVVNNSGATVSNTVENWKDTVRVSVGATHHYSEHWLARVGLAYDQSPVPDDFRTARIPDNNRTWLALGGQYKPSAASMIDFGYAHLFVSDAGVNDSNPSPALVGTYKNSVDIVSAQYTHNF
jgi:long-chain fatty acid transport protein